MAKKIAVHVAFNRKVSAAAITFLLNATCTVIVFGYLNKFH